MSIVKVLTHYIETLIGDTTMITIPNQVSEQLAMYRNKTTTVTSKYQVLDTETLLRDTLELLSGLGYKDCPMKVIGRGSRSKSTVHYVEIALNDSVINIDGGMIPRLFLRNSYNGECSASIQIGILRLVCSNGLMFGTNYFDMSIRHVTGDRFDYAINTIPHVVPAAIRAVEKLHNRIHELSFATLSIVEQIQIVENLGLSDRITKRVMQRLWQQGNGLLRAEDTRRNLWTLWNIVNESIGECSRKEFSTVNRNIGLVDQIEETLHELRAA
jgi:hypothetical protein